MRLEHMRIKGFRSFDDERVIDFNDCTVFIGSNNAGKTAALAALTKLFSHRRSERQIVRSDFHLPKDKKPEEVTKLEMSIECVFSFEELTSKDKNPEGSESVAAPLFFHGMTVNDSDGQLILRVRLEATWERSASAEGAIESNTFFIVSPESAEEDQRKPAQRVVLDAIRMIYIPAVRNPYDETRVVAGSAISSMLGSIKWDEDRRNKVTQDAGKLSDLVLKEPGAKSVVSAGLYQPQMVGLNQPIRVGREQPSYLL